MHNLSEVNNFDAAISVPDDAIDYRTAVSLTSFALQQLTNRTRALYEFLGELGSTISLPAGLSIASSTNSHGMLTASAGFHSATTSALDGAVTCSDSLTVNGAATCSGGLTVTGAGLTASSVNCTGNIVASGTAALQTTSCTNLTVSSLATFNSGIQVGGTSNLFGPVACTSIGRVFRPGVIGTSSTTVLDPAVATDYYYAATLSANTTATITDRFFDGDELFVSNFSSAYTVTVNLPGGGAIGSALKNASGSYLSYRMKRISGQWFVIDYSKVP